MDVTRSNFSQAVTAVETVLPEADFVALDLEFTGLSAGPPTNDFLASYEQMYASARANVTPLQIVQLGLSIFKAVDKKGDQFDCHSFNFYIFPRPCKLLEREDKERYFLSQASSLSFLAEHGFDFNRLILEGVSYLNLAQAKMVKEKLAEQKEANANKADRVVITNELDREFVADVMRQIEEFANGSEERTELALPLANAFRRRLMYEALADSPFTDRIELCDSLAERMRLMARRSSPDLKRDRERAKLLDMVGFSEVVKLLITYRKPLVGHNLYLDLLYIFKSFVEPLPERYVDFKHYFHSLFPVVYDTRYLSANNIIGALVGNNALNNLFVEVQKSPFIETTINLKNDGATGNKKKQHEAGYDSYMTGVAFIHIIRYLYAQELTEAQPENLFDNGLLAAYRNRVGIFRTLDLRCMNLEGEDRMPDRSHVFHITFPKEWNRNNINALFNGVEIGGLQSIPFIDDTSAFVVLKDPGAAKRIVEQYILKRSPQPQPFKIQMYDDFMKQKQKDLTAKTAASLGGQKSRLSGDYSSFLESVLSPPSAAASSSTTSPPSPLLQKTKKFKTTAQEEEKEKSDEDNNKAATTTSTTKSMVNGTATDVVSHSVTSNTGKGIVPLLLLKERLKKIATGTATKANDSTKTATTPTTTRKSTSSLKEEAPDNLFAIPNWAMNFE